MPRYRQETAGEGGGPWSRWVQPRRKGYKLACCDCGLVHAMDFRLVASANGGRHIQFRVKRDNRATAAVRREDRKRAARASITQPVPET